MSECVVVSVLQVLESKPNQDTYLSRDGTVELEMVGLAGRQGAGYAWDGPWTDIS